MSVNIRDPVRLIIRASLGGPSCRSPISYAELVGKLMLAGGERVAFAKG